MIEAKCDTVNDLGRQVGLSRGALQRLKRDGLTVHRADLLATQLGLHAESVWGWAFYSTPEIVGGHLDAGEALP